MALRPKFFKQANVSPSAAGWGLQLDGKPIKTPKGYQLWVPSCALAQALADEWNGLDDKIDPTRLPLTRLANTAIDGTAQNRGALLADLRRYGGNDLICYRCEGPDALAAREAEIWDPLLAWCRNVLGAELTIVHGVIHQPQPEAQIDTLTAALAGADHFALTALHLVAGITGSMVIALALAKGHLSVAGAYDAAFLQETFQAEQWGFDEEATARLVRLRRELYDAARFLALLGG